MITTTGDIDILKWILYQACPVNVYTTLYSELLLIWNQLCPDILSTVFNTHVKDTHNHLVSVKIRRGITTLDSNVSHHYNTVLYSVKIYLVLNVSAE